MIKQANINLSPIGLNLLSGLTLAKQDRWLMRNSLNSDHIGRHNNTFTQAKKLLTTNLTLSEVSNTNIWLSNRFSKLSLAHSAEAAASLTQLMYPSASDGTKNQLLTNVAFQSAITNFNFVETSRL